MARTPVGPAPDSGWRSVAQPARSTTEISFSNSTYRSEFQITVKGMAPLGLDEMTHADPHARTRATVSAHSLGRTLLVALLVGVTPLAALVALTVGGLSVAFLAGAATGAVVAMLRRRSGRFVPRRRAGDRQTATRVVDSGA